MKKVAFVVPRMGVGGVEHSLLGLLQYAPQKTMDITLIVFSSEGELLAQVPPYIHIKYAMSVGKSESMRGALSTGLKKLGLHRIFKLLKVVYHKLGPMLVKKEPDNEFDVIVAYCDGLATWYTAKSLCAAKKIAFVHTDFLRAGYNAETERQIYKEYQQIFFGSQKARTHFLQLIPEFEHKTAILPNCVNIDRIQALSQHSCNFIENEQNAVNIITVGRLSHEKGVEKIPEILRLAKNDGLNIHWYLVGEGPEADNLLALAKKSGVSDFLTLLGLQLNPYKYMAQCDIYVQPSNYEGYCIALAEAQILGLPCVACDFAGADEQIIDGVNGYISGMGAEAIYADLKSLIICGDVRKKMGLSAVKQVKTEHSKLFEQWWQQL